MCYGENNAAHARSYLNAQFAALWQISTECALHYNQEAEHARKPQEYGHRYSFALAEYHFGRHRSVARPSLLDMMFRAQFKAPTVDFVCNHVALLNLHLQGGHYNENYKSALDKYTANPTHNRELQEMTISFVVPFKMTGIRGIDSLIGNGEHLVTMFVFEYHNAVLSSILPEYRDERAKVALEFYLGQYLRFLSSAGHHVFYSLPDFHDDEHRLLMDFSYDARTIPNLQEVHGISIQQINSYLRHAWLKAAMLAGEHEGLPTDRISICLAEYRSTWTVSSSSVHDIPFHIYLAAPEVAALCNEEIVMYFTVDEAIFYDSEDFNQEPRRRFSEWKVAVLMNLVYESEDDGNIKRCKVDLQSSRFMSQFSEFSGYDEEDGEFMECMEALVDFLTGDYLTILENAQYHVIYHYDVRFPKFTTLFDSIGTDEEETWAEWSHDSGVDESGRMASQAVSWRDITHHSDMCGFDEIIALSQAAINRHFRDCYARSMESQQESRYIWRYQDYFEATFKPPMVRLLSNGRALLSIFISEGFLKPFKSWRLHDQAEKVEFTEYRVTFEVDLKMSDQEFPSGVSPEWEVKFQQSPAYGDHGNQPGTTFRHIYLDVLHAEFIQEFSRFDSKLSYNRRSLDKIQASVTYLRNYYLPALASNGDHILYTIPVWRTNTPLPSYGLSSVQFCVYSKETVTRQTVSQSNRAAEPVIIIMGMSGGRPFPASTLQFSSGWVARASKSSYGTIGLAKSLFLEGRLLSMLSEVNRKTTIVPIFSGIEGHEWKLILTTWGQHAVRQHRDCPFVFDATTPDEGKLRYKWDHHDTYNYEHRGGSYIENGIYSVSCKTSNYVEIPTFFRHGCMEIKVGGQVELKLTVNSHTLQWSSQASATWQSSLAVYSETSGLTVKAMCPPAAISPSRPRDQTSHPLALDAAEQLANQLREPIELTTAVREFQEFCGAWRSCYPATGTFQVAHPVFNRTGDLLFEILPHVSSHSTSTTGNPSRPGYLARGRHPFKGRRMFQDRAGARAPFVPPAFVHGVPNGVNGSHHDGGFHSSPPAGPPHGDGIRVRQEVHTHESQSSYVNVGGFSGAPSRPRTGMSNRSRSRPRAATPLSAASGDVYINAPMPGPPYGTHARPTTPLAFSSRPTTSAGYSSRTPVAAPPPPVVIPQPINPQDFGAPQFYPGAPMPMQGGSDPFATAADRRAFRQQQQATQVRVGGGVPPHLNPANVGVFLTGAESRQFGGAVRGGQQYE